MKLIVRPVTFKQHQRHYREKKDAEISHDPYRCALLGQAGKPNTARLTCTHALASVTYAPSWHNECSHFLPASFLSKQYTKKNVNNLSS